MEALKDLPEEYEKSLQTFFDILKNYNIRYLENNQSFLKKNWRYFYIVPVVTIHFFVMGFHIAVLLKRDEMAQVAHALPPFLVVIHVIKALFVATLKGFLLTAETAQISTFIRQLGGFWRTKLTDRQKKEKDAFLWRLNFYNRGNYWVALCGSTQYLVSSLLESLARRFILQQDYELMLATPASYPFDHTKNWAIYILVYIFQVFAMFLLICVYKGTDLIMITLCSLLGIEFKLLEDDLTRVKPDENRDGNQNVANDEISIEECVKRHQILIGLSRQLDNIFNRMIFIDLLFVGITTCAFSFAGQFSRGPTYMLVNYAAVAFSGFTILCLCYAGEQLTGASVRIGDLAYQSLWYKGGKRYKIAVWLIIKISQNPCCLTSLKYTVVSLNLFTKVVSTTWSYFSLMNSFYSEEE